MSTPKCRRRRVVGPLNDSGNSCGKFCALQPKRFGLAFASKSIYRGFHVGAIQRYSRMGRVAGTILDFEMKMNKIRIAISFSVYTCSLIFGRLPMMIIARIGGYKVQTH